MRDPVDVGPSGVQVGVGQRDGELFTAEATERVVRPGVPSEDRCHRPQSIVACHVTVLVVELLEVVEVEHDDGEWTAAPRGVLDHQRQVVIEGPSAEEPRQRVRPGEC